MNECWVSLKGVARQILYHLLTEQGRRSLAAKRGIDLLIFHRKGNKSNSKLHWNITKKTVLLYHFFSFLLSLIIVIGVISTREKLRTSTRPFKYIYSCCRVEQEVGRGHTEMWYAEKTQKQTNSRRWGQILGRRQDIPQMVSKKRN